MRIGKRHYGLLSTIALGAVLAALLASVAPSASANNPVGACCLQNGPCQDIVAELCEDQGGSFIGVDTTCATVNCNAGVGAPVLSILGMVGVAGALGGIGAYRLLRKRG